MFFNQLFSGIARLAWFVLIACLAVSVVMFVCYLTGYEDVFIAGAEGDLFKTTVFSGMLWASSLGLSYFFNPLDRML